MTQTPHPITRYGFGIKLPVPYQEAVERAKAAFKEEGFGTLTEIDVQQTLKDKIGADFRPYTILGICNPHLAHQAFQSELEIGLLLPCNVVVYEADGGSVVSVMDPEVALSIVGNPAVEPIALEAKTRLQRAVERLRAG